MHDPSTQRTFLLYGRLGNLPAVGQHWLWDGATWSPVAVTVPMGINDEVTAYAAVVADAAGGLLTHGGSSYRFGIGGSQFVLTGKTHHIATTAAGTFAFSTGPLPPLVVDPVLQGHQIAVTNQGPRLFGGAWNGPATTAAAGMFAWNGTQWNAVTPPQAPPARRFHGMAWDSVRQVLVVYGGAAADGSLLDDTWEWDGITWLQRNPVQRPQPRCRMAFAFEPVVGRCVLFGGGNADFTVNHADTWTWDGTAWQLVPGATAPAARQATAMVFEPGRQQLLLFGGRDGSSHFADTWHLDLQLSLASYTPFGTGCQGPNGLVPTLTTPPGEAPRLGTTSQLVVGNLPTGLTLPVFVLGLSNTFQAGSGHPLPFDLGLLGWPGCQQLVSHDVMDAVPTLVGSASRAFTAPTQTSLIGLSVHVQAFVVYVPAGVAVSNAVTGVLGL